MSTKLRDGTTTQDPRLDRIAEFDERSRRYGIADVLPTQALRSKTWRLDRSRMGDQGREGACVEFGITHELAAEPVYVSYPELDIIRREHRIYWPAQRSDPWPGGEYPGASPVYEGTSTLAGLKVAQALGYFDTFRWGFTDDERVAAVAHEGPGVAACSWLEGMMEARPSGLIAVDGSEVGGHCVAWIGVQFGAKLRGEPRQDLAVIAQSWGLDYGDRGRVYVNLPDWLAHLQRDGETAWMVGRHRVGRL